MNAPALAAVARPRAGMATLTVDLGAVAANTRLLSARATGELMAVVKADGFGHGAVDVARASLAAGATRLGVTSLAEAVALREAGLAVRVLSWLNPPDADYAAAAAYDIEVGVPSGQHLDAVARRAPGARVHLMLDTGMARDGAAPGTWLALCSAASLLQRRGRIAVVGVMGHLACADDPTHPANAAGRTRFAWGLRLARAVGLRPRDRHLAATAATLTDPQSHHTMSRVGAGLVGIDPSRTTRLRPAMTLTAPVVETREVPAGTPVGYGQSWSAPRATTLGLLPLGYADGLPRRASGCAEVLVRGRRRRLVGQISMDMSVVDLGDEPVRPGEVVTVFGPGDEGEPTVAEWADWGGTIDHEIVTGLGPRLHRRVTPLLRSVR
jgi:alanine racemase